MDHSRNKEYRASTNSYQSRISGTTLGLTKLQAQPLFSEKHAAVQNLSHTNKLTRQKPHEKRAITTLITKQKQSMNETTTRTHAAETRRGHVTPCEEERLENEHEQDYTPSVKPGRPPGARLVVINIIITTIIIMPKARKRKKKAERPRSP